MGWLCRGSSLRDCPLTFLWTSSRERCPAGTNLGHLREDASGHGSDVLPPNRVAVATVGSWRIAASSRAWDSYMLESTPCHVVRWALRKTSSWVRSWALTALRRLLLERGGFAIYGCLLPFKLWLDTLLVQLPLHISQHLQKLSFGGDRIAIDGSIVEGY